MPEDKILEEVLESTEEKVDEVKVQEEKLVTETEKRLEKTFDELIEESTLTEESTKESTEKSTPEKEEKEKPADKSDEESTEKLADETTEKSTEESAQEKSTPEEKPADKPGLSEAYYRAAVHQGWKPEEVKEFFDKDPKLADRTFANIYDSTNKLSREFANIGRAKQELAKKGPEPESKVKPVEKSEYKEVDISKLRKEYDNDPLVEMMAQQQEQNKALFDQVQELTTVKQPDQPAVTEEAIRANIREEATTQQLITTFFGGDDLKVYDDFYGAVPKDAKNWDDLTRDQKINRWGVLEMADQMLIGASSQGREMDEVEAMTLAHLSVSEPIREKVIRDEIKANVVKRGKGLTLKPAGGKKPEASKPGSKEELINVTRQRLAKMNW